MPTVPRDTTNRLKVSYTGPFGRHTMLFHGVTGVSEADLTTAVRAVLEAMKEITYTGTTFDQAEYAAAGSTLFFPIAWVPITQAGGISPGVNTSKALSFQFGARGTDGVRTKLYLYNGSTSVDQNMRWLLADSAELEDVILTLAANDGLIGSVSGSTLTWKPYANIVVSDYWTRKVRG